jgi:hypothetical protein
MKITQLMLIAGFLIVSIPGIYFALQAYEQNGVVKQTAPDINKDIALLKSEINALKKDVLSLKEIKLEVAQLKDKKGSNILQAQAQTDDAKTMDNQQDDEVAQINPIEMGKKQEEQRVKDLEKINNAFLAEASDPIWSPEATSLVTSFFESGVGENIDLSDIQCRKTLCKVEVNKPNSSGANDNLMLSFPMHVAKELSQAIFFHEQNDDGSTRVTMYMARNGYGLPSDN